MSKETIWFGLDRFGFSDYGAGIAWWATGFATTFADEIISNTDGIDYSDHIDII